MTAPVLRTLDDLLEVVNGAPHDSRCLATAARHMEAYEASLLLLADAKGNVIATEDFGLGIGPDVIGPLAIDLARRLESDSTCRFGVGTNVGPRIAFAVRTPEGHQRKILACLLRRDNASAATQDQLPTTLIVCSAFAWAAIRKRADVAKLHRRIQHLYAEQAMLYSSHTDAIAAVVQEREQRRYQQQEKAALEELVQAAQAASEAKTQFLANASHELRTPLTAILGYTDLLADADLSEAERSRYLETIRRNGRVLLELINDILDLSRIEVNKMVLEPTDCSPLQIVDEVVSLMRVQAEDKGLDLRVDYCFPIPQTIQTDPVRLRQILMNLVGNAIKFTEKGTVRIAVRCTKGREIPSRLEFVITDTGIGIPPSAMPQLFRPFAQVDTSTTRQYGGTGLGLAISRRLANMLDGTIEVDSEPGRGSTFTLAINPGPFEGVPMLDGPPAPAAKEDEPSPPGSGPRLSGRVLLVEDGRDNQRLIHLILSKAGLEVDLAENGRDACHHALRSATEGRPYVLILMDMQMPEMDGYEATRLLRQSGWRGPVVALTAHAMEADRQRCLEAGCDDYLSKPIERSTFLETVRHHLPTAAE